MIRRVWDALTRRCAVCTQVRFGMAVGAIVVFAVSAAMNAGVSGMQWTNTEEFCISCHEMRTNNYAEYKDSIHAANRSGVRATCPDCHVPRELMAQTARKLLASRDLLAHYTGTLETKEKFEAKRYELAKRVWTHMQETDSRECRNCHDAKAMSSELQSERAKGRHARGVAEGKTCIDCHYGISHREPLGPGPQELKTVMQ
jgi:cytochrome c-type protein NapC